MRLIEHPAGNENPQVLLTLGDDRRIKAGPQFANHSDFLPEKWMKPVCDPRQAELMSSVLMRCVIRLQRISWNPAPTSAPSSP
jgi:hypothetical protein